MKQVMLYVKELANLYALKTLNDYIVSRSDIDLFFHGEVNWDRAREVLKDAKIKGCGPSIDLLVGCFSDLDGSYYFSRDHFDKKCRVLDVDISILKNCANPLTLEEKDNLRKKYGVHPHQPILVIGYACQSDGVNKLVNKLWEDYMIYLIGKIQCHDLELAQSAEWSSAKQNVNLINEMGILKDYYAMADIAVNAANLFKNDRSLHNFIEATEGGPLFIVKPEKSKQFGYRQLVESDAIKEFDSLDDLLDSIKNYKSSLECQNRRKEHLHKTREKYLPVIFSHIQYMLGQIQTPIESDLLVESHPAITYLMHPETQDWVIPRYGLEERGRDVGLWKKIGGVIKNIFPLKCFT